MQIITLNPNKLKDVQKEMVRRSLKDRKDIKGKDVHHKDNNPMNNDKSNLSVVSQNYNRKEPRLRKLKEKGLLPNAGNKHDNGVHEQGTDETRNHIKKIHWSKSREIR